MRKRYTSLVPLCAAAVVALWGAVAMSAPQVDVVVPYRAQVWPVITSAGQTPGSYTFSGSADTLKRFAADSVLTTDSIYVEGMRYMQLVVYADTTDSMLVPLLQVRGINAPGQWVSGNAFLGPFSSDAPATVITSVTALSPNPLTAWQFSTDAAGSGTPVPSQGMWMRWRIKSNDKRLYASATGLNLTRTGRLTMVLNGWHF